MRANIVTGGPHYGADAAMEVPEGYYRISFYILFPAKCIVRQARSHRERHSGTVSRKFCCAQKNLF